MAVSTSEMQEVLRRIELVVNQQAAAVTSLSARLDDMTQQTGDALTQSHVNLQKMSDALKDSEKRTQDALTTMGNALAQLAAAQTDLATGQQQAAARITAQQQQQPQTEAVIKQQQQQAVQQAAATAAVAASASAAAAGAASPQPAPGLGATPSAPDPWDGVADPWSTAPRQQPQSLYGGQHFGHGHRDEGVKLKDFSSITPFDSDLAKFPDWSDRIAAKLIKVHPRMLELLEWAERQPVPLSEEIERANSSASVDIPQLSNFIYEVMMERTGPHLRDKRRNAGMGRGLEFCRFRHGELRCPAGQAPDVHQAGPRPSDRGPR